MEILRREIPKNHAICSRYLQPASERNLGDELKSPGTILLSDNDNKCGRSKDANQFKTDKRERGERWMVAADSQPPSYNNKQSPS